MNDHPAISVVTVCKNAAQTIERALLSITDQRSNSGETFLDYEHIIIDGGSTDGTLEILDRYRSAQEERGVSVTIVSEPDEGIYDAMNKGLAIAQGTYIGFLNADDRYAQSALATIAGVAKDSGADCIGGACEIVDESGKTVRIRPSIPHLLNKAFPQEMPVAHQSLFLRTELLRKLDGFRIQFPLAADYDLTLRLLDHLDEESNEKPSWVFIDGLISYFTLGGASYHPARTARDYREVRLANGWAWPETQLLYLRNLIASYLVRI
ncbi:MAG: glycosyltransferase [Coriobacteriia bacterium]|nr:glycosyltransferase [Coriobacteriia bacterium]